VATGEAMPLIGGDLVVSAGAKTLGLMRAGRTGAVVNSHEIVTGAFTRDTEFRIPPSSLPCRCRHGSRKMCSFSTPQSWPVSQWAIRSTPT
jgi:indolepyruvate ferredoxin oxidoreductase